MDLYELAQQRATEPRPSPSEHQQQPLSHSSVSSQAAMEPLEPPICSAPPILPVHITSGFITPGQGVPLQEPDEPMMHPTSTIPIKLYPIVFEEIFGKRKRGADIWREYHFYKDSGGKLYSVCAHCKNVAYRAESNFGTSNAKRHIDGCDNFKNKGGPLISCRSREFDQRVYVQLMVEAIMMHGYPFSIVEHLGLRKVHKYLNENVQTISRNTIKKVCVLKHFQFKEKLKVMFSELPGKVSLTSDIWTACTSRSYLTLTAHCVDASWTLRSKVLNFFHFAPPHTGLEIYNTLYEKIKEWGLTSKVLTMTCDNATNMDNMIGHLKSSLMENLPCDGKFFHVRCSANMFKFAFKKLHGDEFGIRLANEVYVQFLELFKHYQSKVPQHESLSRAYTFGDSSRASSFSDSHSHSIPRSTLEDFDQCYGATGREDECKFEFYFKDDKESRKAPLDVLGYWGRKEEKFPILSSMARDILAIPITSVVSESTFSMGGRILNKWRSSLLSRNVEALVTTRNWLFGYEELEKLGVDVDDKSDDED